MPSIGSRTQVRPEVPGVAACSSPRMPSAGRRRGQDGAHRRLAGAVGDGDRIEMSGRLVLGVEAAAAEMAQGLDPRRIGHRMRRWRRCRASQLSRQLGHCRRPGGSPRLPAVVGDRAAASIAQATSDSTRARSNSRLRWVSGISVVGAHQFERFLVRHQVAGQQVPISVRAATSSPSKKNAIWHFQRLGDVPEPRGGDPVHPGFVFLNLLELDSNALGQLLLGHPEHPPAVANPLSDMHIDRMFHLICSLRHLYSSV